MRVHKQVPVKVNAWVDEGVQPLVDALNEFTDVVTVDSCEGTDEEPAHVYFKINGPSDNHALFASHLASAINGHVNSQWFYAVRVEWRSDEPMIELLVSKPHIADAAEILVAIASRSRKNRSRHGSHGKEPRNSKGRQTHQHLAKSCGGTPQSDG